MLPDNVASSIAVPALLSDPDTRVTTPLVDYEMGGVALNDASQGLQAKVWSCYVKPFPPYAIYVKPEGGSETVLFYANGVVTGVSFAFDQNMRPCVAIVRSDGVWLYWYDSAPPAGFKYTLYTNILSPRLTLDDKRPSQLGPNSDVIFAYLRDNALHYRQQRERFAIERTLRTGLLPNTILRTIGMGKNLRLQFELVMP